MLLLNSSLLVLVLDGQLSAGAAARQSALRCHVEPVSTTEPSNISLHVFCFFNRTCPNPSLTLAGKTTTIRVCTGTSTNTCRWRCGCSANGLKSDSTWKFFEREREREPAECCYYSMLQRALGAFQTIVCHCNVMPDFTFVKKKVRLLLKL